MCTLSNFSGASVLIVENDPAIAKGMQRLFEQWGCRTFVAHGLPDVDKHLKSVDRLPDIVVADYHLDGNDVGITAIDAVRAILPGIPALVVTADQSPETREAVRAAQAMLLQKPASPGSLRASVSHLVCKERRSHSTL
jgi:CheY-like chemotaxis protein